MKATGRYVKEIRRVLGEEGEPRDGGDQVAVSFPYACVEWVSMIC
jgi:hypothetical protein